MTFTLIFRHYLVIDREKSAGTIFNGENAIMYIGKQLRLVREGHGLLQKELAANAGLDKSYISKLERGLADPTFSTLSKIAAAYNLSVSHLLNYGSEENFSMDIDAAMDALKTLKYNMVRVEINIKPL